MRIAIAIVVALVLLVLVARHYAAYGHLPKWMTEFPAPEFAILVGMVVGALIAVLLLGGCCERDVLGDCIHRTPGSLNSMSPAQIDQLCNGPDSDRQ